MSLVRPAYRRLGLPVFLAPALRYSSTSTAAPNAATPPPPPPPKKHLTPKQQEFLDRALRVNQAGELGANLIYMGQYAVFKRSARLRPLIQHMWDQEVHHLNTFDSLLAKHRVRPTALRPLWNIAGYALGVGTALLGEKAAMACTEAVETEIGGHYNNQLRELVRMLKEDEELKGDEELMKLVETIRKFRDDELEHLDTAVEYDAQNAPGYLALHHLIRGGCKAAIYLKRSREEWSLLISDSDERWCEVVPTGIWVPDW